MISFRKMHLGELKTGVRFYLRKEEVRSRVNNEDKTTDRMSEGEGGSIRRNKLLWKELISLMY